MIALIAWLERRHAARVRRYNATQRPCVTTKKAKP